VDGAPSLDATALAAIAVPVLHGCVLMLPILLGDLLRAHDENFPTASG